LWLPFVEPWGVARIAGTDTRSLGLTFRTVIERAGSFRELPIVIDELVGPAEPFSHCSRWAVLPEMIPVFARPTETAVVMFVFTISNARPDVGPYVAEA